MMMNGHHGHTTTFLSYHPFTLCRPESLFRIGKNRSIANLQEMQTFAEIFTCSMTSPHDWTDMNSFAGNDPNPKRPFCLLSWRTRFLHSSAVPQTSPRLDKHLGARGRIIQGFEGDFCNCSEGRPTRQTFIYPLKFDIFPPSHPEHSEQMRLHAKLLGDGVRNPYEESRAQSLVLIPLSFTCPPLRRR